MIFELIKSFILGIVQGITEWLPVSSTGHMLLVDEFLKLDFPKDFTDMFFVVIQFGSILAVLVLYFDKLNPFSKHKNEKQKRQTWALWEKVIIACIPAGVVGILFDDLIHDLLYGPIVIAIALIVYGILFIVLENSHPTPTTTSLEKLSFKKAFCVGMFQMLSLIPGTSRSGATILGAMLIGCSRPAAAEFSFFLGIPVMFGASFLKIVKFFIQGGGFSFAEFIYLVLGMVVAFGVSVYSIKFLMGYVRKHDFKFFGYYRIVLGIVVLSYFGISALVG